MEKKNTKLKKCHFCFDGIQFDFEIDEAEEIISRNVANTGAWEQNQLCLYSKFIPENGTMIDIGANVGVNSIYAKLRIPGARVIAIEASPENFEILRKNAHGLGIEAHHLAIADRDGVIRFSGSGTNAKIASEGGYEVRCQTLDKFCSGLDSIDLLKIDVEGFADLVLREGVSSISKSERIIVEFSIGDARLRFGENTDSIYQHFCEVWGMLPFPYVYYISRNDGCVRISSISELMELLPTEYGVGDLLFSRMEEEPSLSETGFLVRRVSELMTENHYRIVEIRELKDALAELKRENGYRIEESRELRRALVQMEVSSDRSQGGWFVEILSRLARKGARFFGSKRTGP